VTARSSVTPEASPNLAREFDETGDSHAIVTHAREPRIQRYAEPPIFGIAMAFEIATAFRINAALRVATAFGMATAFGIGTAFGMDDASVRIRPQRVD
jgi:hypothetical protein